MAERLTECIDSHLLDNGEMVKEYSLNSKIKLNHFSAMDVPNAVYDKLGELEDILEKYGVESVEELNQMLEWLFTLSGKDADDMKFIARDRKLIHQQYCDIKTDRDTWKRACELACEREDDCYVYDNIHRAYEFYQQAKKEKVN